MNDRGTLSRLLDNLMEYEHVKTGEIPIRIIAVANKMELRKKVEEHIKDYLKPYHNKMNLKLYSYSWIETIKKKLKNRDLDDYSLIEPNCYSNVRNLCLLSVIDTGCRMGIFLDDDELIESESYFDVSEEGLLEKACDDGVIYGKAGYYNQYRPSYRRFWELKWWPKDATFNEVFEKLKSNKPRFKASMVALGGNMILSDEIIRNVCFDPSVSRGEDMDYLFNARLFGYRIYFDPYLHIKHLPPENKTAIWKKAREDIYRFLYLREKYRQHLKSYKVQKIAFEEFLPYPGVFMKDDLEDRIFEHNKLLATKYLSDDNKYGFEMSMENAKIPFIYEAPQNIIEKLITNIETWRKITSTFGE
ncbi:MAG: hypothetical protein ACP5D6_10315 [Kosmotogaceae bacterium]